MQYLPLCQVGENNIGFTGWGPPDLMRGPLLTLPLIVCAAKVLVGTSLFNRRSWSAISHACTCEGGRIIMVVQNLILLPATLEYSPRSGVS